ncbi:hypothetical protein BaRGS_00009201 [Batillaria attramentaria]|uniref:Uncharacterized protein n=1 Tax=Batillaria attramentaria TaxID=370345 RepID=A0ABD0LJ43_9CAEN
MMADTVSASQHQGHIPDEASQPDEGMATDSRSGADFDRFSHRSDSVGDMSALTGGCASAPSFSNSPRSDLEDEETDGSDVDENWDPVFEEIKRKLSHSGGNSQGSMSSDQASEGGANVRISEQYTNIPYGIQPRDTYEHGKKSSDIMGVTYNGRMRQFIILDSKGITTWKRDAVDVRVSRDLQYPKYEYRLITYLVYARKYNCYFALGKDFSLKVLNRDFFETCSVSADLRSVLFMLFNPIRDELITGGVGGAKVWRFHQAAGKAFTELKPLANYQLSLKYELPNVGGSWVKRVELDYNLEHLYCCSDTDLHVYDLQGKQLFKFERAHTMSITGCRYSVAGKVLVTSSIDTEVKVWSLTGGLVHTFRGHSRAVTNLLIHPHNSTIVITCSLDGSLRMWSLDTMDCIYSLVVSASGLLWMGLTDDNLLYISTARSLTLWHLNLFIHFWSLTRNQVTRLQLEGCPGKSLRVLAVGEDSSVRLFARSNQKNLSTVLPPPSISPLQKILGVCYSREFNVIFVLINPQHIWVYTTRTDPACRIAVWDVHHIQAVHLRSDGAAQDRANALLPGNKAPSHRATENGLGNELVSNCCCVCILKSSAMLWTDEGCCCPVRHSYLLLGLEDGRVLFMDPVVKGQKFMEFKVSKDPVVELQHDVEHKSLVTVCRMAQMTYVQFWGLPDLELQHEVFCAPDLTAYARIEYTCVTAHESGRVLFHTMELATDPGLHKARAVPNVDDVVDVRHRPEHQAPVITVDSSVVMKIFCSCSNDGAIKVWEEGGALLTEIMLDDSLSAACFLNNSADLIVAFQKHIFFIDHSKVCPHLKPPDTDDDTFDKESFVYEDPAVMYEGVTANPDPIDLENYLVPYEIEFSKDFLEGKLTLEPVKVEAVESEGESRLSLAPTETYLTPPPSPSSLSAVDMTLGSEVTKYDLLQQMKSTLKVLIDKQKKKSMKKDAKESSPEASPGTETAETKGEEPGADTDELKTRVMQHFEFPRFGVSPGPTPTMSPTSTPAQLSEAEETSEEEESDVDEDLKAKLPPKKIPDLELVAPAASKAKAEKPTETVREDISAPKRSRRAIADVEIDVKSLMKERRSGVVMKKEADHAHISTALPRETSRERPHREPVKKKTVAQRKLPKRGLRPSQQDQDAAAGKDEMTQMQRLDTGAMGDRDQVADQATKQPMSQEPTPKEQADDQKQAKPDHATEDEKLADQADSKPGKSGAETDLSREVQPTAVDYLDTGDVPRRAEVPQLPSVPSDSAGKREPPDLPTLPEFTDRPPSSVSVRSRKSSGKRRPMDFLADRSTASVGMSPTAELESRTGADTPTASVSDTFAMSGFRTPSVMSEMDGTRVMEMDGTRMMSPLSMAASKEGDMQHLTPGEAASLRSDTFSGHGSSRPPSVANTVRTGSVFGDILEGSEPSWQLAGAWEPGRYSSSPEKIFSHSLSRSSTPNSGAAPPRASSALSSAASERTVGSDLQGAPASPVMKVHITPERQNYRPPHTSEEQVENAGPQPLAAMCPPDCVCQLPQKERDVLLKKRKKERRISFQGDKVASSSSDYSSCPRSSAASVSPEQRKQIGYDVTLFMFCKKIENFVCINPELTYQHTSAKSDKSEELQHHRQSDTSMPDVSMSPSKEPHPVNLKWSDSVTGDFDLDLETGHYGSESMSPGLPPTPRQSRLASAGSSRYAAVSSAMSHVDSLRGRESVMSGQGRPPSVADSFFESNGCFLAS